MHLWISFSIPACRHRSARFSDQSKWLIEECILKLAGRPHPEVKIFVRQSFVIPSQRIEHRPPNEHRRGCDEVTREHIPEYITLRHFAEQAMATHLGIMKIKRTPLLIDVFCVGEHHSISLVKPRELAHLFFDALRMHLIVGGKVDHKSATRFAKCRIECCAVPAVDI